MTKPRQYVAGRTYKIQRRTMGRHFFFAPSDGVADLWRYAVAFAASKTAVQIHAICVLSNHYHAVVTDTDGRLGEFMAELHSLTARVINKRIGRRDQVWDAGKPSVQWIVRPQDVLGQMVYVIANAVSARLVHTHTDWLGLCTSPDELGTTISVKRPSDSFFRTSKRGCPATIELTYVLPPLAGDDFPEQLAVAVKAEEASIEESHGRWVRGPRRTARTNPLGRPRSKDDDTRPRDSEIVCNDPDMLREALAALRVFRDDYAKARSAFRRNKRTRFPHGTYAMRRHHNVAVSDPPRPLPPRETTHA